MKHYRTPQLPRRGIDVADGVYAREFVADRAAVSGVFDDGDRRDALTHGDFKSTSAHRATSQQRNTAAPPNPSESYPFGVATYSTAGQHAKRARKYAKAHLAGFDHGHTEVARPAVDTLNPAAQNTNRVRTETLPATPPTTFEAPKPRARKKNWRPHCQHQSCLRPASYSSSNDEVPVFCEKHKIDGMQNVVHPNRGDCIHVGCARVSSYATTDDTLAHYCHLHKKRGMVKVRDRIGTRCEEVTCVKQASFAKENERYPRFCKDHKQEDMVNIRNHRCLSPGCSRGASFAVAGDRRGIYCSEHKLPHMVNTRRRSQCLAPGCNSRKPVFVLRGQHLPKFCFDHGGVGMLDIRESTRAQGALPDNARLSNKAAAVVAATTSAAVAEPIPPFSRNIHTPARQPHLHPNINVVKPNVSTPTRTSPSSSASSSASDVAVPGGFESPHARGWLPPGPYLKRRRDTTYPMYCGTRPGTKQLRDEPAPPHAPPPTLPRHMMTENERPPELVSASDRQTPPSGIPALDADSHSYSGSVGCRPRGTPPAAPGVNARIVSSEVNYDDKRCGIQDSDADTHRDAGGIECHRRDAPPRASPSNERTPTGVVKVEGDGDQSVHPVDRASRRFATGSAVRAGRGGNADLPLPAAETSRKEDEERDGGDPRVAPPVPECSTRRTTGMRLRFRIPYASSVNDIHSVFSRNQREACQASATSAGVIHAYDGPPGRPDLVPPPSRPTTAMPVEKEVGVCHNKLALEPATATIKHNIPKGVSSKSLESSVSEKKGSGKIAAQESRVFAKNCYGEEHGESSGCSRTSFYLNLVNALTKKLEGRSSNAN